MSLYFHLIPVAHHAPVGTHIHTSATHPANVSEKSYPTHNPGVELPGYANIALYSYSPVLTPGGELLLKGSSNILT